MKRTTICITEAEALRDFGAVLARVRKGAEVAIERDGQPIAIVTSVPFLYGLRPKACGLDSVGPPGRLLSESIALAEAHGSTAVMDADFAKDVQEAIDSHSEPFDPPEWD